MEENRVDARIEETSISLSISKGENRVSTMSQKVSPWGDVDMQNDNEGHDDRNSDCKTHRKSRDQQTKRDWVASLRAKDWNS